MLARNEYKVIVHLLRNPAEQMNINQLARALKISAGGAHLVLKKFEQKGFVKANRLGNAVFYRINTESKEMHKICELVLIESRKKNLGKNALAKVYADKLESFRDLADAAVLFGSVLHKGEKANDVDVLFIADKNNIRKISNKLLSQTFAKPVNAIFMTKDDLKSKLAEKNKVVLEIIRTGEVIFGGEDIIDAL